MTNEEFQKLVLEKLDSLGTDVSILQEGQNSLESKLYSLEKKIDSIYEQTATLTEFKTETNRNMEELMGDNKRLKEMVGRHDIDIEDLKRKIV